MDVLSSELEQQILNLWPGVRDSVFKDGGELAKFIATEVSELWTYHFGLGLYVRNNCLYPNEQLHQQFIDSGILYTDEMSSVMIRTWHTALNDGVIK